MLWLVHDSIQIEKLGTPSVTIVAKQFEVGARASARTFGNPDAPYVVVPKIYKSISVQQGFEQTREVFDDLVRLMTTAATTAGDAPAAARGREVAEVERFDAEDRFAAVTAMNEKYMDRDWGDGFPLLPATPDAVREMLRGTNLPPDHVVCDLAPGYGIATVEKIAINSVMAGARPEHMPVIIGAVKALSMLDPDRAQTFLTSTKSHASLLLVSGPIAKELGINSKDCMGPGRVNRANLAIGRAYTLCLKNIGQWYLGQLDMDTLGSVRKFTVCIAENEEALSGWEPFHVEKGFRAEDSVVTLLGSSGEVDVNDNGNTTAEAFLKTIAYNSIFCQWDLATMNEHRIQKSSWETIILVPPDILRTVAGAGFTKRGAKIFIHEHARFGLGKLVHYRPPNEKTVDPEWRWIVGLSEKERDEIIMPVRESADRYQLISAGAGRAKTMVIPCNAVTPQCVNVDAYRSGC